MEKMFGEERNVGRLEVNRGFQHPDSEAHLHKGSINKTKIINKTQ